MATGSRPFQDQGSVGNTGVASRDKMLGGPGSSSATIVADATSVRALSSCSWLHARLPK